MVVSRTNLDSGLRLSRRFRICDGGGGVSVGRVLDGGFVMVGTEFGLIGTAFTKYEQPRLVWQFDSGMHGVSNTGAVQLPAHFTHLGAWPQF